MPDDHVVTAKECRKTRAKRQPRVLEGIAPAAARGAVRNEAHIGVQSAERTELPGNEDAEDLVRLTREHVGDRKDTERLAYAGYVPVPFGGCHS